MNLEDELRLFETDNSTNKIYSIKRERTFSLSRIERLQKVLRHDPLLNDVGECLVLVGGMDKGPSPTA